MARPLYFLSQAIKYLRRSPVVAGVTMGTVAIVFLVVGVFALVGHNLDRLAERLQAGLRLAVYLRDDVDQQQRERIRSRLARAPEIASVRYISREQAFERLRDRFGPRSRLLEGLEDNPLPASLEASFAEEVDSVEAIEPLVQAVASLEGVEHVQYGQAWLERFYDFLGLSRMAGLVIGSLIVCATLLIVSNTIRLSVFARRDEIHILKLVGATDRFVKLPFAIEGIALGTAGAAFGVGGTWLLFQLAGSGVRLPLGPAAGVVQLSFLPDWTVAVIVVGGALLGLLGTLTSLWRHLKI